MTQNNTTAGTADLRDYLERALASERGIRVRGQESKGDATKLRQRLYSFRYADRKDSQKIYATNDPRYGKSVYDCLTVDIDDEFNLLIRKVVANKEVEEL
jgi:hypothetical protein